MIEPLTAPEGTMHLLTDSLEHLLVVSARRFPAQPALCDSAGTLSYEQLLLAVCQCRQQLKQTGLQAGDRVLLQLPKQRQLVVMLFACWSLGLLVVPVHLSLKGRQLQYLLDDCEPALLVISDSRLAQLQQELVLPAGCQYWQALAAPAAEVVVSAAPQGRAAQPAAILYTSGSTGLPKGVVVSQLNLLLGATSVSQYLALQSTDVVLALLPFSFDYGLNQLLSALSVGACVVLHDFLLTADVVRLCSRHQISVLAAVPPLWATLAEANWPDDARHSLRLWTNSGGAMPQPLLLRLQQLFPQAAPYLMYGLTEAFRSTYLDPAKVAAKPGSMGQAIPFAEVLVLRPDGSECAVDEPGELVHRGPLVSLGYWNKAELTAERFRPDPLWPAQLPDKPKAVWSGDLVRRDAQGDLFYLGRLDDMLKCSGFRISPTEIEQLCYALIADAIDIAAIGVPLPPADTAVLLLFSASNGQDTAALLRLLRQQLPAYLCPKALLQLAQLPKTANGKLDRKQLALQYKDFFSVDSSAS